ncbi:MAG: large conductance mechanosensitive channel protein MscL [Clostridia bacterium]|nr:large conductance mechanosensitive channel protein MscL [Clostridia bacterium]
MGKKKEGGFWSDFKKFISRGNVVDMAVGVVIGAAFGAIVTGLVKYIINPIVGLITGGVDLENVKTVLVAEVTDAEGVITQPEVALMWGLWIQTIIDFIIVALCIFSIVRLITKMRERMERQKKEEEKKKAEEEAAKAAEEQKAKDAAEAEANAAKAARQKELEDSLLRQEKLLEQICEAVSKK